MCVYVCVYVYGVRLVRVYVFKKIKRGRKKLEIENWQQQQQNLNEEKKSMNNVDDWIKKWKREGREKGWEEFFF